MQRTRDGQRDGTAHAAADNGHFFQTLDVRGRAERADKVGNAAAPAGSDASVIVAPPTIWKMMVTVPGLPVAPRNRERDPLAALVRAQDDELPRRRLLRYMRGALMSIRMTVGLSASFLYDLEHT